MRQMNIPVVRLVRYLDHIRNDYAKFWSNRLTDITQEMIDEFNENLRYEVGNTYIKIITGRNGHRSVHSFIVNKETKKFPVGTILKAATWKAPATNFGRGNISDDSFDRVRWTGVM